MIIFVALPWLCSHLASCMVVGQQRPTELETMVHPKMNTFSHKPLLESIPCSWFFIQCIIPDSSQIKGFKAMSG